MPIINIEFDSQKVKEEEIKTLSSAIHKIVSQITSIEDVPVYANDSQIKVAVSPIEIFIRLSDHKITDADKLISDIKSELSNWKAKNNFPHPINLTLIPMSWKIEIGI